jgi:ABC-type nitrate/sulfonate/bicarbonate transport system permease component
VSVPEIQVSKIPIRSSDNTGRAEAARAALWEYGPAALFVIAAVIAWEVVWRWIDMPEYLFPRPSVIAATLWRRLGLIYPHAL